MVYSGGKDTGDVIVVMGVTNSGSIIKIKEVVGVFFWDL